MKTTGAQAAPAPPSLITSLLAGFDAITNNIGLILFPIGLDLLLWFGPHLRMQSIAMGIVRQMAFLPGSTTADTRIAIESGQAFFSLAAERVNLLSSLRSYPVGIPSLMVSRLPVVSPLGAPLMQDVPSALLVIGLWILLACAGLVAGSLYYSLVAQAALKGKADWSQALNLWGWSSVQVLTLAFSFGALLLIIAIPAGCLLSALSLGGLAMGQIAALFYIGLGVWIIFPLLFSAHGIFAFQFKAWPAMRQSASLTRATVLQTSLLFLSILVISQGMDTLWRIPAENSWLSLLGVIGHAFVSTGLLAASFIYYKDATRWQQRVVQQSLLADSGKGLKT